MQTLYSSHALKRMFQRGLHPAMVEQAMRVGQVIARYPEDQPYSSVLILGVADNQVIHVVVATTDAGDCVVVTAYVPDPALWDTTFTRKLP